MNCKRSIKIFVSAISWQLYSLQEKPRSLSDGIFTAEDGITAVNWGNHKLACYLEDVFECKLTFEISRVGLGYTPIDLRFRKQIYNYEQLDQHGIIPIDTIVNQNTVLCEARIHHNEAQDYSIVYKHRFPGRVVWINASSNSMASEEIIRIGIRIFMPLSEGNKITETGNKGVISKMLHPFETPCTANGVRIDMFNDPYSNPRRGLNGTGMLSGLGFSSLVDSDHFDAWNPVPTDLTEIEKNNQKICTLARGRTQIYLPPYGQIVNRGICIDVINITRSYKHGNFSSMIGA